MPLKPPCPSHAIMLQVEGVGSGAVEAALRACEADISVLSAEWSTKKNVPFVFLADTLEAISGTSKRLEMTSLLVREGLGEVRVHGRQRES